jgi:fumarylacetoacetate (FAA) hydrolase
MRAFVNGTQVSEGNLADMTWTFAQLLERISYGVDLHPGEVIGSGTVGTGCFLELNGNPKEKNPKYKSIPGFTDNWWLKPGDAVVLEIDELGRLENTITAEQPRS